MTAVLDAATTLFATRGPATVSVRDIAAAAGVNHALVHRHFGTKQEVLQAVLERAVQEIAAATDEIADRRVNLQQRFQIVAEHEAYWRALARAILDNEDPRMLQRDFPNVRRMLELLQAEQQQPRSRRKQTPPPAPVDARIVVGTISALIMGWLLFEPFLLAATGLDKEDREKVRGQIIRLLQTITELTH
jgi:AcrR family transcriptional regulator